MLTRALPVLYYFLFECKEPTTSFDVTSTTFGFLFYEDCQQFRCSPMPPTFICFTSSSCGLVFANASNCLHGILVTHCLGVRQCLHQSCSTSSSCGFRDHQGLSTYLYIPSSLCGCWCSPMPSIVVFVLRVRILVTRGIGAGTFQDLPTVERFLASQNYFYTSVLQGWKML